MKVLIELNTSDALNNKIIYTLILLMENLKEIKDFLNKLKPDKYSELGFLQSILQDCYYNVLELPEKPEYGCSCGDKCYGCKESGRLDHWKRSRKSYEQYELLYKHFGPQIIEIQNMMKTQKQKRDKLIKGYEKQLKMLCKIEELSDFELTEKIKYIDSERKKWG